MNGGFSLPPRPLYIHIDEEKIIAIPAEYTTDYKLLDRHLDLLHAGITVATLKGKDYVPHISLALSTAFDTNQVVHYEASSTQPSPTSDEKASSCPPTYPGYILVTYEGFPLAGQNILATEPTTSTRKSGESVADIRPILRSN